MSKRNLQDAREARAAKAKEVKNLLDPAVTPWNAETKAKVDAIYADIEMIEQQISAIERAVAIAADSDEITARTVERHMPGAALDRAIEANARIYALRNNVSVDEAASRIVAAKNALTDYLRNGVEGLSQEARKLVRPANQRGLAIQNIDRTSGATGGVLVPTIVMPTAIAKLKAFGGMRQVASEIATDGGEPISWATYDDTGSAGEWVAENTAATAGDIATFSSVTLNAYKFSSKIITVSIEILQDSAVDVEAIVMDALFTRTARGHNTAFTVGAGTTQPTGIVGASASGVVAAVGNTTSVSYDNLVDLEHSLDPAYRRMPSVGFMFHDSTLKILKKLKDGNGRPLWLPSTESALDSETDPATFLGYRYTINQDVAVMAANAKSILFGAFEKYLIRDVMAFQVLRFTDSVYAKNGQVGFMAWSRVDGNLIDATNQSIKYFQNSAT